MDCKLAWLCLLVEAWVGSSAGLLSNWQRAGPKSLASFRRGSIPVRMPWDIPGKSERVGGTEDGAEAVPGRALAACGAML